MEPFRIICETCRSRLKIRSAEVIGEIHACPKCGSMVHIVPPPGWQADTPAMPTSQPGTPVEAALALSTTASVIIPAGGIAEPFSVAPAPEVPAAEAPLPVSPAVQAGSHLMLWAVGGTAVFLVSGLAWAIWPSSSDRAASPSPPAAVTNANQSAEQPKLIPTSPTSNHTESGVHDPHAVDHSTDTATAATHVPAVSRASKSAIADSASSHVGANDQPHASQSPAETKTGNTTTIAPPSAAAVAVSTPPNATAQPPKSTEQAARESKHSPVLKFDPLDFDPDRLGTNAKSLIDVTASSSSILDQTNSDVGGDHPAGNGVAAANGAASGQKDQPAGDRLLLPAANRSVMVRRGQPAVEGSLSQKVGEQLAIRLNAFQVTEMPIARLVETLSDIAGSGITLDPLALELVGASPRSTVTVNEQDATLEKILQDAVAQRRLDVADLGDQVRIVLSTPDERRATDYDVSDLVGGQDAAEIGKLVERFVAPTTWKSVGGIGTIQVNGTKLHIEQSDSVSRQIVIFCERLRLARGLVPRSKYPAALLSIESPYKQLAAKLSEHATFTFLDGTRVADVVHQWEKMCGLTILVDWAALSEAELSLSSPIACSAIDRAWAESLDGVLEPLGLGWWAVDGETIQITSLSALEKIERIEFYQLPPGLRSKYTSGAALIDALRKEIGEHAGKHGSTDELQLTLDEPSGRLIVSAWPGVHRFLSQRLGPAMQ